MAEKDKVKVRVTQTTKRNPFKAALIRIKTFRFSAPFRKLLRYKMWLSGAFMLQGLIGLVSLQFFSPSLSGKPSRYVASQRARCNEHTEYEQQVKEAEKAGESVSEVKAPLSEEDELDNFMESFTKKNAYDSKGKWIGKEGGDVNEGGCVPDSKAEA